MVKVMGKYTGRVYYSCPSKEEANKWILAKKIFEPLVLLVLSRKEEIV